MIETPSPLISIVTACYDCARYLPECLASVQAQTTEYFEHVVVLDGCHDESVAIAERAALADTRVRIRPFLHFENRGIAAAYNTAIALARCDWLLKLDADDTFEPTYVAEILRAIAADGERNVVFSWCHLFGDVDEVYRYPAFDPARMADVFMIPGPAAMHRELWGTVGGFRKLPCAEDWDLYVRAECAIGLRPYQIPAALWNYRQHGGPRLTKQGQAHLPALQAEWRELLKLRGRTAGTA